MMGFIKAVTVVTLLVGQLYGVAATSPPINTPAPMAQPAFSQCEQFAVAGVGQNCHIIAKAHQLSIVEFMLLNPSLMNIMACQHQLKLHHWYCVKAKPGATYGNNLNPSAKNVPKKTSNWGPAKTTKASNNKATTKSKPRETKAIAKETKTTKTTMTTKKAEAPKTTSKAVITSVGPDGCGYGDCWYAFGTMSSSKNWDKLSSASKMCSQLLTAGQCTGTNVLEFPGRVNHFCKDCDTLSSACPCFLGGNYHTRTYAPVWPNTQWTRAGMNRGNGFLPPDM